MTATDIVAARPGPRSWLKLTAAELKMVVRDTSGLIVPIALPVLILVMSASTASQQVVANGRTALDVFVLPLVTAIILSTICIINMPSFLAYYRHAGILRRLAVTPASPAMVLVAHTVVSLVQALVGMCVALALAVLAFDANAPVHLWAAIGIFALSLVAFYGIGMVVASVAPSPNSAVAIGLALFFAIGALGGMFGGTGNLPEALETVGEWLPFGATVQALGAAWAGAAIDSVHVISLAVSAVVGIAVAAVAFRWD
ncbi:MAG: ABC transporter permease [Propionibacterium sp.]|nr:ABC transporter permease [Propionibacterium sp.]